MTKLLFTFPEQACLLRDALSQHRHPAQRNQRGDHGFRERDDADEQRALAASAILASVDRQGRVNVDEKLRAYAGLELDSQIVVAGNLTRLELWSPERYARIEAEGTDDIAGAQA